MATEGSVQYIILACRDVAAANKAADTISSETGYNRHNLVVLEAGCDLSEMQSVREYARAVKKYLDIRRDAISVLINNAGIGGSSVLAHNSQGYDKIFATNHLGHFLLTLLLLPRMAKGGRVINVSSEVHDPANKTPLPDPSQHWPSDPKDYHRLIAKGEAIPGENDRQSGSRRYSRSKLLNVMFTYELARRLARSVPNGTGPETKLAIEALSNGATNNLPTAKSIQIIAMNPGLMLDTGFFSNVVGKTLATTVWFATPVLRLTHMGNFLRSGPRSGEDLAALAVSKDFDGITATYFDGAKVKQSSEFSRDLDAVKRQQELWEHSILWAKVTKEELQAAGF